MAFSDSYIPFLRYHSAHHCMETYLSPSRLCSTKSFLNKGIKPHPIPTPCYGQGPFHQPRLPKAPPALPGMGYLQLLWAARASVLISRQKRSERLQQEVGEANKLRALIKVSRRPQGSGLKPQAVKGSALRIQASWTDLRRNLRDLNQNCQHTLNSFCSARRWQIQSLLRR